MEYNELLEQAFLNVTAAGKIPKATELTDLITATKQIFNETLQRHKEIKESTICPKCGEESGPINIDNMHIRWQCSCTKGQGSTIEDAFNNWRVKINV